MPSGGRSSEPVSYPIGGHEQMVVSVNLRRMDPGRAREAGIALGWRYRAGSTAGRTDRWAHCDRAQDEARARIATVDLWSRRPREAFEHPCALGG